MTPTDDLVRARLVDGVMARVEAEPTPTPGHALIAAVGRHAPIEAYTALATAWRLATLRARPVPLATRVRAAALALGVGGMLASSGAVALASVAGVAQQVAGHFGGVPVLEPARPNTTPALPSEPARASESPLLIITSPEPVASEPPDPTPLVSPAPTPAPTVRPTASPGRGGGGSGSGGSSATPRPTETPSSHGDGGDGGTESHSTDTPLPTATPQPTDKATDGGSSAPDSSAAEQVPAGE